MTTDDPNRTLGFVLHDVARLLRTRFEQNARDLGLTRAQWQVLAHIMRHEGLNQAALAEILELEPITLGRIVDRLEALGLAERRAHPNDRRMWTLHLTGTALPILEKMKHVGAETREEALSGIAPEARDALMETLLQIRGNLSARLNTASAERAAAPMRRAVGDDRA